MGTRYDYRCTCCEMKATVSGGADEGFIIRTDTAFCRDCRQLVDYVTEVSSADARAYPKDELNACPSCSNTNLVRWKRGDPCPLCAGEVVQERFPVLEWD